MYYIDKENYWEFNSVQLLFNNKKPWVGPSSYEGTFLLMVSWVKMEEKGGMTERGENGLASYRKIQWEARWLDIERGRGGERGSKNSSYILYGHLMEAKNTCFKYMKYEIHKYLGVWRLTPKGDWMVHPSRAGLSFTAQALPSRLLGWGESSSGPIAPSFGADFTDFTQFYTIFVSCKALPVHLHLHFSQHSWTLKL